MIQPQPGAAKRLLMLIAAAAACVIWVRIWTQVFWLIGDHSSLDCPAAPSTTVCPAPPIYQFNLRSEDGNFAWYFWGTLLAVAAGMIAILLYGAADYVIRGPRTPPRTQQLS